MTYGEPLISVLIPSFNRDGMIARAVLSALRQSYSNTEVVVVDDGSTDCSVSVVKRIALNNPKVRLMEHKTNRGGSAARNTAIDAARGEIVAFLDSDDEWDPRKLERQMAVIHHLNGRAFASYTGFVFHSKARGAGHVRVGRDYGARLPIELAASNVVGPTSTVLVERHALLDCGGFDEGLPSCQDWDLWLRLSKKIPFYCVPTPLVSFNVDPSNRISDNRGALFAGHRVVFDRALQGHWNEGDLAFIRAGHHRTLAYLHLRFGQYGLAARNAFKCIMEDRSPRSLRRLAYFANDLIRASVTRHGMH